MADVYGLNSDVYFGGVDEPLPDWRKEDHGSMDDDDAEATEAEVAAVERILGFSVDEIMGSSDDDDPEPAES